MQRRKICNIVRRQSAKFIRARLFLRYVLELRIENITSAVSHSTKLGACIVVRTSFKNSALSSRVAQVQLLLKFRAEPLSGSPPIQLGVISTGLTTGKVPLF